MAEPVLVGCAHGTRNPAGRRALAQVRLDIAALRPGLEVVAASVDVQKPELTEVVGRLARAGRRCVVVPLLLSAGYHVYVDVAEAVAAAEGLAIAAASLGPDDALVEVLAQRLAECSGGPGDAVGPSDAVDAVVLAAAGSSDPRAVADVRAVAAGLAGRLATPVFTSYLSAAQPSVGEVVRRLRGEGRTVTIVTYLLAPGFFADRLHRLGADRVSHPLAPHPLLAELALRRYDEALAAATTTWQGGLDARIRRGH